MSSLEASTTSQRQLSAELEDALREARRSNALLEHQTRLLGMMAKCEPLARVLETFCHAYEELSPGSLCSILLVELATNRLRHGAAPSLPASYIEAIDGLPVGPCAGSCGTAVFRGEPVVVADISSDPLWGAYRDLAHLHRLEACWSIPIYSSQRATLGSFAVYGRAPGIPTDRQLSAIEQFTNLISIA
ncbi:MAG: GAF domain-containing protein, partial [Polyangiaceae bacterium]